MIKYNHFPSEFDRQITYLTHPVLILNILKPPRWEYIKKHENRYLALIEDDSVRKLH
jgi:hypothetical protein